MTPPKKQAVVERRWIRIGEIGTAPDLTADDRLRLTAVAMSELAIAQALKIVHGENGGAARYVETGGCVRFDEKGEPVVPSDAKERM